MKYDNYIFDLYGTLVDINTDEEDIEVWTKLSYFYGYYNAYYTAEQLQTRYLELVGSKEKQLGDSMSDVHEAHPEIRLEDVFRALYEEKGVQPSEELVLHTGQFFRSLTTKYIKLYDGVISVLSKIKEEGKNVYLLSNAQRIFTEYELKYLGIDKYFDDIFISSDYGTKKPDKRFYCELIHKHSIDVTRSIMIGNDMTSDIGGAKVVGLYTMYIHSIISPELENEPQADYVLEQMDMSMVLKLL